jgi:hypothetical protein
MVIGIVLQSLASGRASPRLDGRKRGPIRAKADTAAGRPADDLPRSIRRAAGLDDLSGEAIALAPPARATAAARAFAAGNGYLPGLIVDRLA